MKRKNYSIYSLVFIYVFMFLGLGISSAQSWPKFTTKKDFQFPTSPGSLLKYTVKEKSLTENEAQAIAEGLGIKAKLEVDYIYAMPPVSIPQERGKSTEEKDDERSKLAEQPNIVWPPARAERKTKIFIFKGTENSKFLKIQSNNGLITYSNLQHLRFDSRQKFQLSDKESLEVVDSFLRKLNVSVNDYNEITYSEVLLNKAQKGESEKILQSIPIMKEVTFRKTLAATSEGDRLPVVGGGSTIRSAVGLTEEKGQAGVGFVSQLSRELVQEQTSQSIVTAERAFARLQEGQDIVNDNLRFYSEGDLVLKDAFLAYYSPTGNQSTNELIPVWHFLTYDSKNPSVEVPFYVKALDLSETACAQLNDDLSITIPYIKFDSLALKLNLQFAYNLFMVKEGLYWKLDLNSVQQSKASGSPSCSMNANLDLFIVCLEHARTQYKCDLLYQGGMGDDPFGHYWKLDVDSLKLAK